MNIIWLENLYVLPLINVKSTVAVTVLIIILGHTLKCKQPRLYTRCYIVKIVHKMLINYDVCGQ